MTPYPKPSIKYKNVLMEGGYYEAEIIDTAWMQPKQKEGQPPHDNWMLVVKFAVVEEGPYFNNKISGFFNLLHTSADAMKYSRIAFENLCKAAGVPPFEINTSLGPTREDDQKILYKRVSINVIVDTTADGTDINRVKGFYNLKKKSETPPPPSEDPSPDWSDDNNDSIPF